MRRKGVCEPSGGEACGAQQQQQHNSTATYLQRDRRVRKVRGKALRSEFRYRKAPRARMRLSERSRGISTVTSSPYEDAPGCRSLLSLDAQCSTNTKHVPVAWFERKLITGISMRLFPRRRRGLLLVVTMTMEAFAMRSEGRTASNFWK